MFKSDSPAISRCLNSLIFFPDIYVAFTLRYLPFQSWPRVWSLKELISLSKLVAQVGLSKLVAQVGHSSLAFLKLVTQV